MIFHVIYFFDTSFGVAYVHTCNQWYIFSVGYTQYLVFGSEFQKLRNGLFSADDETLAELSMQRSEIITS